jgi:hypothetical protein
MQFDKDLQSLYLTEVTKKDIIGGLSEMTDPIVYCLEYENESPGLVIDKMSKIIHYLKSSYSNDPGYFEDAFDEDDCIKEIIAGEIYSIEFTDNMYWKQIFISTNKNDIRNILQKNLNEIYIILNRLN